MKTFQDYLDEFILQIGNDDSRKEDILGKLYDYIDAGNCPKKLLEEIISVADLPTITRIENEVLNNTITIVSGGSNDGFN